MSEFYLIDIGLDHQTYTTKRWEKWGLTTRDTAENHHEHDLVASYLENHAEDAYKYLDKESGYGVLDILNKAEKLIIENP